MNPGNVMLGVKEGSSSGGAGAKGKGGKPGSSSSSSSASAASAAAAAPAAASSSATPTDASTFYLVDFGVADTYRDIRSGTAKPGTENGTPYYSSVGVTLGKGLSPVDDVESLGYLLLYALGGGSKALAWSMEHDASARCLADTNKAKVRQAAAAAAAGTRLLGVRGWLRC
jgi:hypothetical protein